MVTGIEVTFESFTSMCTTSLPSAPFAILSRKGRCHFGFQNFLIVVALRIRKPDLNVFCVGGDIVDLSCVGDFKSSFMNRRGCVEDRRTGWPRVDGGESGDCSSDEQKANAKVSDFHNASIILSFLFEPVNTPCQLETKDDLVAAIRRAERQEF